MARLIEVKMVRLYIAVVFLSTLPFGVSSAQYDLEDLYVDFDGAVDVGSASVEFTDDGVRVEGDTYQVTRTGNSVKVESTSNSGGIQVTRGADGADGEDGADGMDGEDGARGQDGVGVTTGSVSNGVRVDMDGTESDGSIYVHTHDVGDTTGADTTMTVTQIEGSTSVRGEGLNVQLQNGATRVEMANVLVDLDAERSTLIQTEADLATYADLLVDFDPVVEDVEVNGETVSVSYQDSGRFLGIFPLSFTSTVMVDADHQVRVKAPWYSFLVFGSAKKTVASGVASDISVMTDTSSPFGQARILNLITKNVAVHMNDGVGIVQNGDASVETSADGSVRVEGTDGQVVEMDADGNVEVTR